MTKQVEYVERRCLLCRRMFVEKRAAGRPRLYCFGCGPKMDLLSRRKAARKYRKKRRGPT